MYYQSLSAKPVSFRSNPQQSRRLGLSVVLGLFLSSLLVPSLQAETPISLFNGRDLSGWKGLSEYWSVEDGAITGITTAEAPLKNNTFLVWEGEAADFELTLEYRVEHGNSGIQYRSELVDEEKFIVKGYQADIDATGRYNGINYEERGRGILAERGEIIQISADGSKEKVDSSGDSAELQKKIDDAGWNRYRIVANGTTVQHFINDALMSEVRDLEESKAAKNGIIAFQIHVGPPMKVQFKNILLKKL